MYNPELYHYGVKGMKWGVRRRTDRGSSGSHSSGPRTSYGKNRAYAKAQDKANKALWKADKARWKETKAKVKSGDLSKKSAEFKSEKKQYKSGKARYSQYNQVKSSYSNSYGMSKAARGKHMQKLNISAKQPISNLKTSKVVSENTKAFAKQYTKYTVGSFAASAAVGIGANYLMKRMNMNTNNNRLLGKGDTIYLKPRQYKVYSR